MSDNKPLAIVDQKRLEASLHRAKSRIVIKNPFFSNILLNQKVVYAHQHPEMQIPTMGVDGRSLYVNLEFLRKKSPEEIIGVLIHECMHLCWNHVTRRGSRDPKIWNYAGDYAINPVIKAEGFTLPEPHLDEERFHGKTADEIYSTLRKENPDYGQEYLDVFDNGLSEADKKKIEHEAKVTIAKALQVAGDSAPEALKKELGELMEPDAPWEQVLREFMQVSLGNDDSTWRRPHRNHIHNDVYIPSTEGVALPKVVIMIDTSGSIYYNKDLFESFSAEINSIVEDLIPEQVDIYYVDTDIQGHDVFNEGEVPVYNIKGGGGTDFTSFFKHMETEEEPACMIMFTDMYANGLPSVNEGYPIPLLWCVYENSNPPEDVAGKYVNVT